MTAVVNTASVPHIGTSPGAFARPRWIPTIELTDSTSRYREAWILAIAATT